MRASFYICGHWGVAVHVKELRLKQFKRFTNLKIEGLPADARLVVLTGPNGSGKSVIIEAFNYWRRHRGGWGVTAGPYFSKTDRDGQNAGSASEVEIDFHETLPGTPEELRALVYIRSAYRHEAAFKTQGITKMQPLLEDPGAERLIEVEKKVQQNYNRLVSRSLAELYAPEFGSHTANAIKERLIGKVRTMMSSVFGGLMLESLGDPIADGTFHFSKGSSRFPYEVLSGGERAAFDLVLDFVLRTDVFDNAIYCLDEPELHIGTRVQAKLIRSFMEHLPAHCQLWVATHSIGMLRESLRLHEGGQSVTFIDTGAVEADGETILRPIRPTRQYWKSILEVALDDMAALVAPSQIFLCEGSGAKDGFDAVCYRRIFQSYSDIDFVSIGDSQTVKKGGPGIADAIRVVAEGTLVRRIVDGDDHTAEERAKLGCEGVLVLPRRSLESYLLDDEILEKLCASVGQAEQSPALRRIRDAAVSEAGGPADDYKKARQKVHQFARNDLRIPGLGSTASEFLKTHLAPLVTPDTGAYVELRNIFQLPDSVKSPAESQKSETFTP